MNLSDIIKDLYNQIKDRWYSGRTLLLLLGFATFILLWLFSGIDIRNISTPEFTITVLVLGFLSVAWFVTTRLPKSPKKKIGFGVALVTETKEQHDKIYNDFILTLRELLYRSRFRYQFEFIVYPQHFAERIETTDDAIKFLKDSNLRFLIYGRARTRKIDDKDTHIIKLEGLVSHKPINPEFQKQFSAEFGDLFPRRMEILSENDIFSFELRAELVKSVAMYIISMGALVSGDILYSQDLLEELNEQLKENKDEFPALVKLRKRIPLRLKDVYSIQAQSHFVNWTKTGDQDYLLKSKPFLDKIQKIDPGHYDSHVKRALWLFVVNRDIAGAKKELNKCKNVHYDISWRYSFAFLLAYEGNLEKAVDEYKRAFKGEILPSVLGEIIDFIERIVQKEPEKNQLLFCLGLIYYLKLKNDLYAFEAFNDFLNSQPDKHFSPQKKLAESYIRQIKRVDNRVILDVVD